MIIKLYSFAGFIEILYCLRPTAGALAMPTETPLGVNHTDVSWLTCCMYVAIYIASYMEFNRIYHAHA